MPATTSPPDVDAVLGRYRQVVGERIDQLLPEAEDGQWLGDLVADYPRRGGKGVRPAILLATCQAWGGSVADALGAAAGIELLHNAFLIHDDIEDASELRRGRPTLHALHGVPLALNAGDGLALLAAESLRGDDRLGSRINQKLTDEFRHMTRETVAGQATELGWRRDCVVDLTADDYLEMIGRKTCWYTTMYPLRVGALIGSRASVSLTRLNRFGFFLGSAFQIRDDLLNLVGSEKRYGKELFGDIREGKRTLMLIHLLNEAAANDRAEIVTFLQRPEDQRDDAEVAAIYALMQQHGSVDYAVEFGQGIAAAAYDAFDDAFSRVRPSRHKAFLEALIDYMLNRQA